MKTDLSIYDAWYHPAPKWKIALWMIVSAFFFDHKLAVGSKWKAMLLRKFGAKVGKGVVIKPSVNIKYPWFLQVGNYSWIGENVWIDNITRVTIGENVCISQGALLLTGNHNYQKDTFDLIPGEIQLEDGVWIGAKSVVCPGVRCRTHAVLAVCSVANKDLDPYSIYQGNPAVRIRERRVMSRKESE